MASYNKTFLMGNLTRDPEARVTPGGMAIATFGLAVNRTWRDRNTGEQKDEVTFVDITAFGSQAETIQKHLSKGSPIFVEGRLKLEQWDDRNTGEKRSKLGVILEAFQFIGARSDSDQAPSHGRAPNRKAPSRSAPSQGGYSSPPVDDFDESDIPF